MKASHFKDKFTLLHILNLVLGMYDFILKHLNELKTKT